MLHSLGRALRRKILLLCYLVREDEDVDDVEDGAENTDGDCQVAVYVLIRLQHQKVTLFPLKICRKKT